MQLTWLNLSQRRLGKRRPTPAIERERECSKPLRTDSSTRVITQFLPLDPAIVNDTIPASSSVATWRASGLPATLRDRSGEFS
jgi:hypothetical protein